MRRFMNNTSTKFATKSMLADFAFMASALTA
jgi:hypothetical protein